MTLKPVPAKPVRFLGDSQDRLRGFPGDAGHQLYRVQLGLDPDDWKPMPSVSPGVREIRVRDDSGAYRVIYIATFAEAVYVLHAFKKTTRKTTRHDLELARQRLQQLKRDQEARP